MATAVVQFEVVGEEKIHCEGCEARIANALRRLPGVANVEASAETQRVSVAIDPEQTNEKVAMSAAVLAIRRLWQRAR